MANGELISQVDQLLQQDTISPKVAQTLTLKLLRGIYETQQEHSKRLDTLETANKVEIVEREKNVTWPWVKDALAHPVFMMVMGAVIAFLAGRFGGG